MLRERAVLDAAGIDGWRTCSPLRCSQLGVAELAGAVPCHLCSVGAQGPAGSLEWLGMDAQLCVSKLCYMEGSF